MPHTIIKSSPISANVVWLKRFWLGIGFVCVLLLAIARAQAEIVIPPLKKHVTDLTATLSAQELVQLEQKLAAFEKARGSQIAVLIVPTTQPEAIEQYAIRVVESWKLGRKGVDDGILLLIAKDDRALRIEVGYGLEGVVPDAKAKRIVAEIITPQFKQGHFAAGIHAGADALIGLIKGEPLPLPDAKHSSGSQFDADSFVSLLVLSLVLGRILQVFLGRLIGSGVVGIGLGLIGWMFFSSVAMAAVVAVAAFVLNLFLNANPGIYRGGHHRWPNQGYRGGGLGGGGGFGGGGGGFGGGGASGRW